MEPKKLLNTFIVKGERCSGTVYLEKLIEQNLCVSRYETPEWKHGYFGLSVTDNFGKSIDYLTVFVFRNVFDWLRSFYLKPHHLEGTKSAHWEKRPTFSKFIRKEVKMFDDQNVCKNMDRHPFTLENPKNLLELRKWKIENWLSYKKTANPAYYLKYEDLMEDPENVIREINDQWFGVEFSFQNWRFYQNTNLEYKPIKYFYISEADIDYLLKNVDWDLEAKVGYQPPQS
jgi:hypothetical protein